MIRRKQTAQLAVFTSLVAISLNACSSDPNKKSLRDRSPDEVRLELEREELKRAAQAPLYDFNLKRDEIPAPLANLRNIYSIPPKPRCQNMRREVDVLTSILGPDSIITEDNPKKVLKLNPSGAIESTMTSFIPFNDMIKYLSGAKAQEKKLARAYFRGQARRSFLRGWAADKGCATTPVPAVKPRKNRRR